MNRAQKAAWWVVVTTLLALTVSLIVFCILYTKVEFARAMRLGFACMGLVGLSGLAPIIFKKDKGKVKFDERDKIINIKAGRAGFGVSYGVFGLLSMTIWGIVGAGNTINVDILPLVWVAAFISTFFTHSVATLILYGRGGER
ncbi:MAG: hypothetical protein KAS75_02950 [Planctomycetes bacterium]|nr:hypothetical protein [Planctomycetota bacterium]